MSWYNNKMDCMIVDLEPMGADDCYCTVRFTIKYHGSKIDHDELVQYARSAEDFVRAHVDAMTDVKSMLETIRVPSPPGLGFVPEDK